MQNEENPKKVDVLHVTGVVTFYWAISLSLVFINKTLLAGGADQIAAPFFVTWFQCLFTTVVVWAIGEISGGAGEFPIQTWAASVSVEVLPLSIMFVLMIALNNLCLQYVEVSFYQVARSFTIIFNVAGSYLILGQTTTYKVLACLVVVMAGFFCGVDGEVNYSFIGTVFGVGSSMFVCLNSIYTKKTLPKVSDNMWKLCFYNNLNATVLFIPAIIFSGEIDLLVAKMHLLLSMKYWAAMTIAGSLGLLIGIATVMQIKATSPLSHNISGTAKAAFQTGLAFWYYQNPQTPMALMGVALVLSGSFAYSYFQMSSAPVKVDTDLRLQSDKLPLIMDDDEDTKSI